MELVACQQSVYSGGGIDAEDASDYPHHHYLHFRQHDLMAMNQLDTSHVSLYYLFGDDSSYAYITNKDGKHVIPFYNKSREGRFYAGKVSWYLLAHDMLFEYNESIVIVVVCLPQRQNTAYALASVEREEVQSVRRAFDYFSAKELEVMHGGIGNYA